MRELKKKKKPTGSAAKTMSDWGLLERMMFLRDFIKHRRYNIHTKLIVWMYVQGSSRWYFIFYTYITPNNH